jgi:hypothetical protein
MIVIVKNKISYSNQHFKKYLCQLCTHDEINSNDIQNIQKQTTNLP